MAAMLQRLHEFVDQVENRYNPQGVHGVLRIRWLGSDLHLARRIHERQLAIKLRMGRWCDGSSDMVAMTPRNNSHT